MPGVSLWGSAPPSGGQHPGGSGGSALIPGHLLSLEAPSASQVCGGKVAVRFPRRPVWVWGAGRSLWRVAGRARSQRGGHSELTNWESPWKFGRGPPVTGFLPLKSIPGQSKPTSHPNSWRRGTRRARGSARRIGERPAQAARPLQRRSAAQGAGPTASAGPVPRVGAGHTRTAAGAPRVGLGAARRRRRPCARPQPPGEAAASSAGAGSPG